MPTKNPTKDQQARWNRAWYEKNKEKRRAITKEHRRQMQSFLHAYKAERPCPCGEGDIACLQFHHVDPNDKDVNYEKLLDWSMKRILNELEKCTVLCSNCHLKLHSSWKANQVEQG